MHIAVRECGARAIRLLPRVAVPTVGAADARAARRPGAGAAPERVASARPRLLLRRRPGDCVRARAAAAEDLENAPPSDAGGHEEGLPPIAKCIHADSQTPLRASALPSDGVLTYSYDMHSHFLYMRHMYRYRSRRGPGSASGGGVRAAEERAGLDAERHGIGGGRGRGCEGAEAVLVPLPGPTGARAERLLRLPQVLRSRVAARPHQLFRARRHAPHHRLDRQVNETEKRRPPNRLRPLCHSLTS